MAEERFQDHFSKAAARYRRSRPGYPEALYDHLASLAPGRDLAWDCATGNGQAALALAERFDAVIATDASVEQLGHAQPHPKVTYAEALASASGIDDASVDLVTVAAALHWFANDDFYDEVRRVAKPGGILAAWSYGARVEVNREVDEAVIRYAADVLGPYWPEGFVHNVSGYKTLPFPFETLEPPALCSVVTWTLDEMIDNVRTWSGYTRFTEAKGREPLEELEAALRPAWGEPDARREVQFPLHFKIGRVK